MWILWHVLELIYPIFVIDHSSALWVVYGAPCGLIPLQLRQTQRTPAHIHSQFNCTLYRNISLRTMNNFLRVYRAAWTWINPSQGDISSVLLMQSQSYCYSVVVLVICKYGSLPGDVPSHKEFCVPLNGPNRTLLQHSHSRELGNRLRPWLTGWFIMEPRIILPSYEFKAIYNFSDNFWHFLRKSY